MRSSENSNSIGPESVLSCVSPCAMWMTITIALLATQLCSAAPPIPIDADDTDVSHQVTAEKTSSRRLNVMIMHGDSPIAGLVSVSPSLSGPVVYIPNEGKTLIVPKEQVSISYVQRYDSKGRLLSPKTVYYRGEQDSVVVDKETETVRVQVVVRPTIPVSIVVQASSHTKTASAPELIYAGRPIEGKKSIPILLNVRDGSVSTFLAKGVRYDISYDIEGRVGSVKSATFTPESLPKKDGVRSITITKQSQSQVDATARFVEPKPSGMTPYTPAFRAVTVDHTSGKRKGKGGMFPISGGSLFLPLGRSRHFDQFTSGDTFRITYRDKQGRPILFVDAKTGEPDIVVPKVGGTVTVCRKELAASVKVLFDIRNKNSESIKESTIDLYVTGLYTHCLAMLIVTLVVGGWGLVCAFRKVRIVCEADPRPEDAHRRLKRLIVSICMIAIGLCMQASLFVAYRLLLLLENHGAPLMDTGVVLTITVAWSCYLGISAVCIILGYAQIQSGGADRRKKKPLSDSVLNEAE